MRNLITIGLSILLCLGLTSCGYRFSGGGDLPGGAVRVAIPTFKNLTAESGIENTFTTDMVFEFNRFGKPVTKNQATADAILHGTIRNLTFDTISREGTLTTTQRRVYIIADMKLVTPEGKVVWKAKGVRENEEYDVTDDKLQTEQNRREAIDELSKRFAESVYQRLTDNF